MAIGLDVRTRGALHAHVEVVRVLNAPAEPALDDLLGAAHGLVAGVRERAGAAPPPDADGASSR